MRYKILLWPALTLLSSTITILTNLIFFFADRNLLTSQFNIIDTNKQYDIEVSLQIEYTIFAWITIYSWNLSWQIYLIYIHGHRFNYMKSVLFGNLFYQSFIISNIFNTAYIILLIYGLYFTAGIMLIFLTISLFITNYLSHQFLMFRVPLALYSDMSDRSQSVESIVKSVPFWLKHHNILRKLFYWLLLNAIPFYATYSFIELCIMLGSFFKHYPESPTPNITNDAASYITMSVLTAGLMVYWIFDFGKFSKDYFINTYSPYLCIDTTLIAQIVHIYNFDGIVDGLMIFGIVLLGISVILTMLKVYNGCKVYQDIEYKPRHTVFANNRYQSLSIDADRHTQLSGVTTESGGQRRSRSKITDPLLEFTKDDENSMEKVLRESNGDLNEDDNFV